MRAKPALLLAAMAAFTTLTACDYCPRPGVVEFAPDIQCRGYKYPVPEYGVPSSAPVIVGPLGESDKPLATKAQSSPF